MDPSRFDAWTRRRFGLAAGGLAAAWLRLTHPEGVAAAALCKPNGAKCREQSNRCKASNCLQAPFTVTARWANPNSDHDTYVFVPPKSGTPENPYIDYSCHEGDSLCETAYPFVCVDEDVTSGPGDEITTFFKLRGGTYEYWIEVDNPSPENDLTVVLRNRNGNKVRSWSSPANPDTTTQIGWHVFDIDGATGSVKSFNDVHNSGIPAGDFFCPTA